MGKPSQKMWVTDYRMSVHFGLGHSLDAITEIRVDDKVAWSGYSNTKEIISINQPELFGGREKEGGLVGNVLHLPGRADQTIPDWMAERFGLTEATMPGCRGYTSLFFYGSQDGGGADVNGRGFMWRSNSPIVAQSLSVTGIRSPPVLNPAHRMIGANANPAYMIYEALIDDDVGMGKDPVTIDTQSYLDAGETLFNEGFGMSVFWAKQSKIEDLVAEFCDHIQATQFLSPQTGLWTIKLLRDDFDVSELRQISPSNAKLSNFRRATWGELANVLTVSYTDPANEEAATVTAMDLSSIAAQGAPVPGSRDYYGIRDPVLAMKVAERDVRSSATPLINLDALIDRSMWDAIPGECFRLTWPKYGLQDVVVRALGINTGKPGDSKIKLSLVQDVFSLSHGGINVPPDSAWVEPGEDPEPIAATEIITLPAYFVASSDLQSEPVVLVYPEVLSAVLAYQPGQDTALYDLMSYDYDSTGTLGYVKQGTRSIVERAVLMEDMPAEPLSGIPAGMVARPERGPRKGGFVFMGAGDDESMEIAQVIDYDEPSTSWILARGVLDTIPRNWTAGTPLWFVNPNLRIVDEEHPRTVGEDVTYKLLSRTSRGVLALADAPAVTETMNARPHLPLRPANVKVNGVAFGSLAAGATEFAVTWATRNRFLEDGQVIRWTAGAVPPEASQGTTVTVYDQDGVKVYEQTGLWTQLAHTLQASWFARYTSITIEVTAEREGLKSLQGHRISVLGLPGDLGAALPPEGIDTGPPPPPDPAPEVGAWAATGYLFNSETGERAPAILVSGKRERADAAGLLVRYKKTTDDDWFYLPEVILSDNPKYVATTAVATMTEYNVEIAYHSSRNTLSEWLALANVVTGGSVSGNTLMVHNRNAVTVISDLDLNAFNTSKEALRSATWRASTDEIIEGQRTLIDQLGATTDAHTVFITNLQLVDADTGVGKAVFSINVDGHIIGRVDLNDGTVGTTYFVVDVFGVVGVDPDNPKIPFYIDTIADKIGITADVMIDGDLTVTGSIHTPKIADNNITAIVVSTASSLTYGAVGEVTIFTHTLSLAYPATIIVWGQINYLDGGGNPANYHQCGTNIYVDGVLVAPNTQNGPSSTAAQPALGSVFCAAGTHSVVMKSTCKPDDYYQDRTLVTLRTYK